jgi:hypothetical protein
MVFPSQFIVKKYAEELGCATSPNDLAVYSDASRASFLLASCEVNQFRLFHREA